MQEKGKPPQGRQKIMTLLNTGSSQTRASHVRETVSFIGRCLFDLFNGWIAAVIARHERHASLAVLRSLSDRELRDMGLYRGQIGDGLADAARDRASRQHAYR